MLPVHYAGLILTIALMTSDIRCSTISLQSDKMDENNNKFQTAVFGGGCFWCLEAIFTQVKGVISVTNGYSGGKIKNPTYREVCSGLTGHAEVVKIVFDPEIISYKELLIIFFHIHDPTTLNRQGADVGTQYRSVIFYNNENQETTALSLIDKLTNSSTFSSPIVTELSPLTAFYVAETYHQEYYFRNPDQPYCIAVISPKVKKFRKVFNAFLKTDADN